MMNNKDDKDLIKNLSPQQENQSSQKNHFGNVCNQSQEKSDSSKNEVLFSVYKKRPGTNDAGKEFEYMMCALYALKLSTNKDIVDFKITTNNEEYGDFDDISLEIKTVNESKTFLVQLKHKESEKQFLTDQKLISSKEFTLTKYLESFEKLNAGDVTCLVYTNNPAKLVIGSNFDISYKTQKNSEEQSEERKINVKVKKPQALEFLHFLQNKSESNMHLLRKKKNQNEQNSNENDNIFQFDITQNETTFLKLESFCANFFLMTGQDNVKTVKETVRNLLTSLVKVDIYDSFIFFMKEWWSGRFVLTKRDVISKLVELAMSPWIQPVSSTKVNSKTKLLSTGIMNFDITVIKDANNDVINSIWDDSTEEPELGRVTHKYHIQKNQNQRSKILWILDKVPLIVKVNPQNEEQVEHCIELLECLSEKKKLILVGDVGRGDFPKWEVLENLKDLYSSKDIYDEVVGHFRISLQGRKSISLEELIRNSKDFLDVIEMDDLLRMSQQECLEVGNIENSLPEFYIPRKVSTDCVDTTDLLDELEHVEKNVLIINCPADFKNKLNTRDVLTMGLDEFLERNILDKFKNLILLSIDEPCIYTKFECVRQKLNSFQVYLFQTVDNDCCIHLMNVGQKELLKNCKNACIEETKIFNYFKSELNVLFAPPGMGKTTLFNVLSQNCPPDLWVVRVKLINRNLFLETHPDEQQLLKHFLGVNEGSQSLYMKILRVYLQNKKILILLDGVDELDSQNVNFLLNCAKCLSSQGFHVWISSRENLQQGISENLEFFTTIKIVELSEIEQKLYIEKRLENKYNYFDIKEIVDATFESTDIANSRQLLGIPLQLYIITENFLTNENLVLALRKRNIFVLTTMYRLFFNGKKKYHFEKVGIDERSEQLGFNFEHHLKQYELPALKVCLDDQALKKLNLDESQSHEFLRGVETKGDKFGIIKSVTPENTAVFYHQTYAEYFACKWLEQNLDKVKLLREEWFSEKYENLRLIFDIMLSEQSPLHLAVIFKNIEQFRKYISSDNKDKAGRNAAYLACCYGQKYPLPRNWLDGSLTYMNCHVERESEIYVTIVRSLLERCQNIFEKDTIFGIDYINYALSCQCLYVLEACLERKLLSFGQIDKLLEKYYRFETLAFYASQMDYIHLLKNVLQRVGPNIIFRDYDSYIDTVSLLNVAIIGSKNQHIIMPRKENVASVEEILKHRDKKIITVQKMWGVERFEIYFRKKHLMDKQLEDGTLLELSCKFGCYKIIKILLPYHRIPLLWRNNILHLTAKFGTLNDEVLEFSKTLGLNVNQENQIGQTPLDMACERGNEQCVKKLLDFGAEVDVPSDLHGYPLLYACEMGRINVVKLYLQHGAKVNVSDSDGNSVLHYAVDKMFFNEMSFLNLLIKNDANVNLQNSKGQTPLHLAVKCERWDMNVTDSFDVAPIVQQYQLRIDKEKSLRERWNKVETLLDSGADINVMDNEGMTVLHHVASYPEDLKIIRWLGNYGAVIGLPINGQLRVILDTGGYIVNRLYDSSADINFFVFEKMTVTSTLPVDEDLDLRDVETVKRLLDNGDSLLVCGRDARLIFLAASKYEQRDTLNKLFADMNVVDNEKITVRHFDAGACEEEEKIKLLIDKRVNLNAQNILGETALHLAVENRNYNKFKALVKFGADVDIADNNDENVLHYAMRHISISREAEYVSKLLISNDININVQNVQGESPLHLACQYHDLSVVRFLCQNGADENLITSERRNMLHYAAESWCQNNITELLEKGFDRNAQDVNGTSILHCACKSGRLNNIQILISSGASIHVRDNKQQTILHYAAISQHPEEDVMKYLVETGVDIYARDSKRRNALDVAFEYKCYKALQLLIETEKFFYSTEVPWPTLLYYSAFGGCCYGIHYLIENCDIGELDRNTDFSSQFLKCHHPLYHKFHEALLGMTKCVYILIEVSRNYPTIVYEPRIFIEYCKFLRSRMIEDWISECIFKYPDFCKGYTNTELS